MRRTYWYFELEMDSSIGLLSAKDAERGAAALRRSRRGALALREVAGALEARHRHCAVAAATHAAARDRRRDALRTCARGHCLSGGCFGCAGRWPVGGCRSQSQIQSPMGVLVVLAVGYVGVVLKVRADATEG